MFVSSILTSKVDESRDFAILMQNSILQYLSLSKSVFVVWDAILFERIAASSLQNLAELLFIYEEVPFILEVPLELG